MLEETPSAVTHGQPLSARETVVVGLVQAVIVYLIYAPLVQADFLFRDDYSFFTLPKGWAVTKLTLAQARPGMGLLVDALNTSVIRGAGARHLVPVFGLSFLAVSVYAWLRINGLRLVPAMLWGLAVCALPSFQSTAPYLTVASSIYASLLSCLAVIAFFHGDDRAHPRRRLHCMMLTSVLLFMALSCYQPGAMFCWAVLIVPVHLSRGEDWPRFRIELLKFGLLFGATLAGYLLVYKTVLFVFEIPLSARAEWADPSQVVDKVAWFFGWFLPYIGREIIAPLDFTARHARTLALIALALAVGGLLCSLVRSGRPSLMAEGVQRLGFLFLLVVLCYLPFIVIREYGTESIYTTAVQTGVLLAVGLGVRGVLGLVTSLDWRRRLETGVAAAAFCLLAVPANANMLRRYAFPNHNEYRYVKSAVAGADLTKITRIHVVGHLNFSEVLSYSEALVQGVLNEVSPRGPHPAISSSSRTAPAVVHPEILRRHEALAGYYQLHPTQGYYVLKPDLTVQQRAAVDGYFAKLADDMATLPNALIVDLSRAIVDY